ncbi:MAG TPA: hybrid sensor histidine kinase/response regulator [Myxococcales bacterium]|nr:hybrid sensor histidine kinase/response regulator [Deltaproteobacteria bacterium]HAA55867.1 hybrid sensor histidine kinase/response regulator [Myxococcales bacterium]|tara:strand:+ start:375 stop:1490 length:1116 start_codon:yes stop_codon:yes gene_type:complete
MASILIVDDEPSIRLTLREFLKNEGHSVETACDVPEAEAKLQQHTFDVVVCDIILPKINGVRLLHHLHQRAPEIQVIMITGSPSIETATEAVRAGAYDYLCKPIRSSEICRVVNAAAREKLWNDEKKRLEEENKQHQAKLEHLVRELRTANKDLKAFNYSVSHDLRSPLRAIGGLAQILYETHQQQLPDDAKRLVQLITQNAEQMEQLIQALLSFSRLGRKAIHKQSVDPHELIQSFLKDLPHNTPQSTIELDDLPSCQADPALLTQVFFNLINNAIKFSQKEPHPKVRIFGNTSEKEHVYHIRDNGVGFDMRYADKLFDAFQRLHPSEDYEGTGVGLSIAQRIVQRHGGRIWAESQPGEGATFSFSLPLS